MVLNEANVNLMKKKGRIVWLKALPETIKDRMMLDQDTETFRPSLTSKDSFSEIEETLTERESFYKNATEFFVDTDECGTDEIADIIIEKLKLIIPNLKRIKYR